MSGMIFSDGYDVVSALDARRFKEALEIDNLEKAVEILERLPRGMDRQENAFRARALIEGYRAIVKRRILNRNSLEGFSVEDLGELRSYINEFGSLKFSRKILDAINEHMDISTPEGTMYKEEDKVKELESDLHKLRRYRGIGTIEEFIDYKDKVELQKRESIDPLDRI